ncbi:MAG: ADP-ribosylglycohydrolase family protein, partial [Aggregatilineales bacterium]
MSREKIEGCLFGLACGDALGADTEFINLKGILEQFPPDGPLSPPGNPAKVTDDTQMTLALGRGLLNAEKPFSASTLNDPIQQAFIDWYNDDENNRAPGNTCLEGCENLLAGKTWVDAGNISSKGCGANMRVAPVGLLLNESDETRAAIAQFQSAFTHAHATAMAAADLTAYIVHYLATGGVARNVLQDAKLYARSQRHVYHEAWLGNLWERAYMMRDAREFIAHGWNECLDALQRVSEAPRTLAYNDDPCTYTGQ